jgi:hypothetical protein
MTGSVKSKTGVVGIYVVAEKQGQRLRFKRRLWIGYGEWKGSAVIGVCLKEGGVRAGDGGGNDHLCLVRLTTKELVPIETCIEVILNYR